MAENIDTITLAGTTLRTTGPVAGKPIAEFSAGLKVGPATYDERLGAFWLALDDFSGGVGYRHMDIRDELGLVWDNQGLDLTRRGHLTLPPLITDTALTHPAGYKMDVGCLPSNSFEMCGAAEYMGFGSGIYRSTDFGKIWALITDLAAMTQILSVREFNGKLYAFGIETWATAFAYWSTATPETAGTWTKATAKPVYDAIVWDSMLVGMWDNGAGVRGIVFSVDGTTWNYEVVGDAAFVWVPQPGPVQFVGGGSNPWDGGPCIYLLAIGKSGALSLFALDLRARKAVEIDVTGGTTIMDACIWNGNIVVNDGYNVYLYGMESQQIRNISLPRRDGVPPCMAGGRHFMRVFGVGDFLYANVIYPTDGTCQVWRYNGAGWSPFGPTIASFYCITAGLIAPYNPVYRAAARRLVLAADTTLATHSAPRYIWMDLPGHSDVPEYGTDSFSAGPLYKIGPWLDMGFHELDGALFWLKIHGYNLSSGENVKVEYQLDYNEAGAWTQMVNAAGTAAVFTAHTDTLYFKPGAGAMKAGIQFRAVRFRTTLVRGATATKTPEVKGFVLLYDKKPECRTAWAIKLDINGMLERPNTYLISGATFTVARLWAWLKAEWDVKTLLTLTIPNVTTEMLVRIADMPITIEDFRTAVSGKGFVDIQFVETTTGA